MAKRSKKRAKKMLSYAEEPDKKSFKSPKWLCDLFPIVTARLDEIRRSFPPLDFTTLQQLPDLTQPEQSHINIFNQFATISAGLIRMSQFQKGGEIHAIVRMVIEEQVEKAGYKLNTNTQPRELMLDWEKREAPYSLANAGVEQESLEEYHSKNFIAERSTFNRAQVQTIVQLVVACLNFAHQSFNELAEDLLFDRQTLAVTILRGTLNFFVPCRGFKGTYLRVFADAVSVTSLEQVLSSDRSPLRWSIFSTEIGECFRKAAIDEGIAEEDIEGFVMEGVNTEASTQSNNSTDRAKKARSFFTRTADWYYRTAIFTPHHRKPGEFTRRMKGQVERYRVRVISGNDSNSYTLFTRDELDLCLCYVAELDKEPVHYETLARLINILLKKQLSLGFRLESSLRRKFRENFLYLAAALKAFGKPVEILKFVDLPRFNSLNMEEVDDFAAQLRSQRPDFTLCSPDEFLNSYEPPIDDEDSDDEEGGEGGVGSEDDDDDDDDHETAPLSKELKRGSSSKDRGGSRAEGGGRSRNKRARKHKADNFDSDDDSPSDSEQFSSAKRARGDLDLSAKEGEQSDAREEQGSNRRKSRRNVIDYSKAYSADVEAALEALGDVSESDSGEESDSFEEDGFESDAEHDKEEDVYADDEEDQDGMEEAPEGHREEFEQDLDLNPFASLATSQDARSSGSTPSLARSSPRDEHSMDWDDFDSYPTDSGAPPYEELERGQMKEDEENMGEESDAEDEGGDFVLSRQVQLAAMKATTCFQDLDEDEEFFQVGLNSLSESTLIAKIQHRSNASPDTPVWKICSEVLAEEWD